MLRLLGYLRPYAGLELPAGAILLGALVRLALSVARRLLAGRTTFVIAHRLSTIALADDIVVLEDGRIAARGTYDEMFPTRKPREAVANLGRAA